MSVIKNLGYIPPSFNSPKKHGFFDQEDHSDEYELECVEFMTADLERSGLTIEDLHASPDPWRSVENFNDAAYLIPYNDLEGRPIRTSENHSLMYRRKLRLTKLADSGTGKYNGPSREQVGHYANIPYIPLGCDYREGGETLYICEGEKKTLCAQKYMDIEAIGIGGCWNWVEKKGSKRLHPWISQLVENYERVVVVPDGDIQRYDINTAYGTLAGEIRRMGKDVVILAPADKIDDLIVQWLAQDEDVADNFSKIPSLDQMVQSWDSLIEEYDLSFKVNGKGARLIHQTTGNIALLLDHHPTFPTIWRNLDTNDVHFGNAPSRVNLTEMAIANYIQHYFQMEKVTHRMVRDCISALALQNEKSPYKDWLLGLTWDGQARLDSWMQRLWGVEVNEYTSQASARWLISSVARLMEPGCKVDWMLVTVGGQGVGKTTMPDAMFDKHTVPVVGKQTDADTKLALHSALCAVIDEMDALYKGESTFWKSLISLGQDHVRAPYSAAHEWKTRRFVLYGTTNMHEWLPSDQSGYRRYVSIDVGDTMLDFAGLKAEREQLWAEAVHRWRAGEVYWEVEHASEIAEDFVTANPVEEKLLDFIDYIKSSQDPTVCRIDSAGRVCFVTSAFLEWAGYSGAQARNAQLTKEIAAVLRKQGASKRKANGRREWVV